MDKFTCGYRKVQGLDRDDTPFKNSGSNMDHWGEDGTCSFCGSANPDDVLKWIALEQVEIGPTDKSYKIYLKSLDPNIKMPIKAYFYHFSKEQAILFTELWNDKKMKVGYPGHFYSKPLFWA